MSHILSASPMFAKFEHAAIDMLQSAGYDLTIMEAGKTSQDEVIANLRSDTVAIVSGLEKLDECIFSKAPGLKVVVKHGVGVDNIDLEAAKAHGVAVYNEQGSNSDAVADLAMCLIFALSRKLIPAVDTVRSGGWSKTTGDGVWGKTIGVLGFGNVGQKLALRAKGMEMRVLAYDPYFNKAFAEEHDIEQTDIETIVKESDYISLHMPLLETTRNMISTRELGMMKRGSYLINTARGGLVDEDALYDALRNGQIAGAAFDAYAQEPPVENKLLKLTNFIGTPHMGGYTKDALSKTSCMTADTIIRALSGETLHNRIV